MRVKCEDCARTIYVTEDEWEQSDETCRECGGDLEEIEEVGDKGLMGFTIDKVKSNHKEFVDKSQPIEEIKVSTNFNPEEKTEFD